MLLNTKIEAALTPNGSYVIPLRIDGQKINIKFDIGASNSIISAEVFNGNITDEEYLILEEKLSEKYGNLKSEGAPFIMEFKSATGHEMKGYLSDAGKVKLGDVDLEHFYYYFVPRNKRAVALLGDNFLRFCEYNHPINGNLCITKIDITAYEQYYKNAINQKELLDLIDEITNESDNLENIDEQER